MFQDYKLLPNRTAYENVAFALQCIGKPKAVIKAQVPEVLRLVGLAEQMDSLPDQLSGGEQQRVSVARAMVNRPPLLICDEPTGNLDPAISLGIMKLLERINRTGTTVIVATHDRAMVDSMQRRRHRPRGRPRDPRPGEGRLRQLWRLLISAIPSKRLPPLLRQLDDVFGAVITIFLSLFIIGLFIIGSVLVNSAIGNVEDQVTIQAYISDNASDEDVEDYQDELERHGQRQER